MTERFPWRFAGFMSGLASLAVVCFLVAWWSGVAPVAAVSMSVFVALLTCFLAWGASDEKERER